MSGPLTPGVALGVFGAVTALLLFVGPFVPAEGLWGIVLSQALFVAGPPLVAAARSPSGVLGALGIRRPSARHVVGAALVGGTGWLVLSLYMALQEQIAPTPPELTQALEELLDSRGRSIAPFILALAVAPAIAEELLCRGALARALERPLGGRGAVVASAALFALLHLSPYRFVPTFLLGLVLGAATVVTRSVVPAMIVHALNNGTLVWLSSDAGVGAKAWLDGHGAAAAPLALAGWIAGLWLLLSRQLDHQTGGVAR